MIIKVLFVCVHNSARSQMAEAFLNTMGQGKFAAESAGLEPGKLNPVAVFVMKEAGIDISRNSTKSVADFISAGKQFDYVITVCDEANAQRCPVFPGKSKRLHMEFKDPSAVFGTEEEKLKETRIIRDQIQLKVKNWIKELHGAG